MYDKRDIQRVIEAAKIEEVVKEYYPDLQKEGSRYKLCCPVHNEKTPSFVVTPARNMFYCFGCGVGGNCIDFLMKVVGMDFVQAMEHLAKKYNIQIEDKKRDLTPEEIQEQHEREAMLNANRIALEFFCEQIKADNDRARLALEYCVNRWNKKTVDTMRIGFAPGHGTFMAYAKEKGLSIDLLLKLGLLRKSKEDGRIYDAFYDRIVIPIRSISNQVLGFTARLMTDGKPKYVNSSDSIIFKKGEIIFGLNTGLRKGQSEELFYLVEGAPDVIKLQSIGIENTICPLGTAWTDSHIESLKRYNPTVCFIPDIDKVERGQYFGTGIKKVMETGLRFLAAGIRVIVREIPQNNPEEKEDPDSYISSVNILNGIPKQDFLVWYAGKRLLGKDTNEEKAAVLRDVAKHLALIEDREVRKMHITQLAKLSGVKASFITTFINEAVKGNVKKKEGTEATMLNQELYQKYGFNVGNNYYYSLDNDGNTHEWSNFVLEPLFHIKDAINPKRLFRITNIFGQTEIIELKQEDLVSLQRFKLRVEGEGNFIWKAKEEQLTKLKGFLYEKTETAVEITQLGWQPDEFFAFGNGAVWHGQWMPVDDFGIVRLGEVGNFYLPAASMIYRSEKKLFQFERKFIHAGLSEITLRAYADKLVEVFGNNAKVGLCFFLATLFRDIVTSVTKNFPVLNLFGPKGSGKSELGHSLMSFFIIKNEPPNITMGTDAGLADTIAQCANALVHIDEYKNTIDLNRREFIKGLYDNVGRTRMNMDRDKKRETTAVDCGVILSGQEMPTIDIAIFSRMIFLTFKTTEFSMTARQKFDELKTMRDLGCSHLVIQLLRHRKRVESEFSGNYNAALHDIQDALHGESVEDRIFRNWCIPAAIFRTLSGVIDLGFDYKEMLKICVDGIILQNKECRSTNEIASFWNVVDFLHQNGDLLIDADYRIDYVNKFKGKGMKEGIIFPKAHRVLFLSTKRAFQLYRQNGKKVGDATLPETSLRFYLENSKEFLGIKNAVRFKNLGNTRESTAAATDANGSPTVKQTSRTDWALAFDYDMLVENFGVNLEVEIAEPGDIDPTDIDENDKSIPFD